METGLSRQCLVCALPRQTYILYSARSTGHKIADHIEYPDYEYDESMKSKT